MEDLSFFRRVRQIEDVSDGGQNVNEADRLLDRQPLRQAAGLRQDQRHPQQRIVELADVTNVFVVAEPLAVV